ncbi:glycoside hydrolase family 11 protein [Polyplosphaeria fusca]|uniref:Endo-1,4-beta-xylanase n=1 Tax=Polyplosphaeria fusca TaxID=682080 RepID=A0A9P4R246_9PLEO|nr:glycoside hydrolase family 11 protein [Polyplosphaeria fusca]
MSYLLAAAVLPGALSAPATTVTDLVERQGSSTNTFQNWKEGSGNFQCNNQGNGKYSTRWSGQGGFVCGSGWKPGGARSFSFDCQYSPTGPGYLSVYGWTRNPLIEYYVVEAHGDLLPGEPWTSKGNVTIDGAAYQLFQSTRVNKPSIIGTTTFNQFWAVRTEPRTKGSLNSGSFFNAWKAAGMNLGQHDYMAFVTEGFTGPKGEQSSGTSQCQIT